MKNTDCLFVLILVLIVIHSGQRNTDMILEKIDAPQTLCASKGLDFKMKAYDVRAKRFSISCEEDPDNV